MPGTPDAQQHEIPFMERPEDCVTDLKKIYKANNEDMALAYLNQAEEKWGQQVSYIFKSWKHN